MAPEDTGCPNGGTCACRKHSLCSLWFIGPWLEHRQADRTCATCLGASSTKQLGAGLKARKVVVHSNQKGSSCKNFCPCCCSFSKIRCKICGLFKRQFYLSQTILRYVKTLTSFLHSTPLPTSLPPIPKLLTTQPPLG